MAYFDLEDVRDELLRGRLTAFDADESTRYVDGLAARLGVRPDAIRSPTPYPVERLALFYALMVCARNLSTLEHGHASEAGDDPYELKRRLYDKEYREWEGRITARTLTGDDGADSGHAMPLSVAIGRA